MRLEGKIVSVTGAAGSLGSALAAAFAREGAAAVFVADLDLATLAVVAEAVAGAGSRAHAHVCDVTDGRAVDELVAAAIDVYGRLDVMVNNAGVLNPNRRIHNLTDADWRRVIDVNLMGTVHGIRSAVQVMRGQEAGGSIVNTASIAGISAWSHAAPYGATKAAIIQLTKIAALEYARERIRVNCVCPGTFLSNIHAGLPEEALKSIGDRHPLGLGAASDLVGAFVYLASDEARWTTGSALVVDGGYSA